MFASQPVKEDDVMREGEKTFDGWKRKEKRVGKSSPEWLDFCFSRGASVAAASRHKSIKIERV